MLIGNTASMTLTETPGTMPSVCRSRRHAGFRERVERPMLERDPRLCSELLWKELFLQPAELAGADLVAVPFHYAAAFPLLQYRRPAGCKWMRLSCT